MGPLELVAMELRHVRLPLVSPFRTAFGTQTERDLVLVRALTSGAEGWGECVAMTEPLYSEEYTAGAHHVMAEHLIPRLLARGLTPAHHVDEILADVRGHRMAKAAVELALLDAELRTSDVALSTYLGATRDKIECGVSVGIMSSIAALLDAVDGFLARGYRRIKLKIAPGWDVEPVAAVRERFGDILLQVDANAAYGPGDARHLARLDDFDLLLIEQPLAEDDLRGHAALALSLRTPLCLDESITSARAASAALAMGACQIVNIKAGRVGGYLEARRVHEVCAGFGAPVWCGGMVESGIGRAANVALAGLPGFSLPGDTSASDRFFAEDIVVEPLAMTDGLMAVPTAPGTGVELDEEALARFTLSVQTIKES